MAMLATAVLDRVQPPSELIGTIFESVTEDEDDEEMIAAVNGGIANAGLMFVEWRQEIDNVVTLYEAAPASVTEEETEGYVDALLALERRWQADLAAAQRMFGVVRKVMRRYRPQAWARLEPLTKQWIELCVGMLEKLRDARWRMMAAEATILPRATAPVLTNSRELGAALKALLQ